MPLVAKADVNEIYTGGQTFQFTDGTRQVSQAEADALARYVANGGPAKVEIEEQKTKKKGES